MAATAHSMAEEPIRLEQPLAVVWNRSEDADYLGRIGPRTLRVRRLVHLGAQGSEIHDLSPDATKVAFARRSSRVRIFDIRRMKRLRDVVVGGGWPTAINWTQNRRVVVIMGNAWFSWVRIVDPVSGEQLHDDLVDGMPFRVESTRDGVAFLTQHESREGVPLPATLAVADDMGRLRTVTLERIKAGSYMPEGGGVVRSLEPALAVRDESAVVVGTNGVIAHVDLNSMKVTYPRENVSFFDEIAAGLVPTAEAKLAEGTSLWATWINEETLAITGRRTDADSRPRNNMPVRFESTCAGIHLLDTTDWSLREFTGLGDQVTTGWGLVLAYDGDCRERGEPKTGLVAYDDTGEVAWRLFKGKTLYDVNVRGRLAFVTHGYRKIHLSVVDLERGLVWRTQLSFAHVLPY
jgi:hypothetical protein